MKYEKGDVCVEVPKYVKERKLLSLLEKVETLGKFDRGMNTVVVGCHYNVTELTYADQDKGKHSG